MLLDAQTHTASQPNNTVPQPGTRHWVEFRGREAVGIFLRAHRSPQVAFDQLKSVIRPIDVAPVFSEALLAMCFWAARYYQHPLGEVFHHALPVLLRNGEAAEPKRQQRWCLTDAGRHANIERIGKRAPQQARVLEALQPYQHALPQEMVSALSLPLSTLKALQKKQLLDTVSIEPDAPTWPQQASPLAQAPLTPNEEQQHAIDTVQQALGSFTPILLEGITGSGKTEVYLQAIERCLTQGQQALVLVPEIGLTPQTIQRFQARFTVPIVAMHSNLTDAERLHGWLEARDGRAAIIIGTRSAIFTAMRWPGLIIIDEEHDTSFKQQDGFRYCARDLALVRAKLERIPVVLGSATPALESLHNAQSGRYQHRHLRQRAGNAFDRHTFDDFAGGFIGTSD